MDEPFITVDLHGMRCDEAEKKIEKVLASAGTGTYQIRLIHGFNRGTNLRDMIYDSFKYDKKVKEREKEADIPWFTQKANKAPDKELALFTQATGAHLNSGGCPALGSLPHRT